MEKKQRRKIPLMLGKLPCTNMEHHVILVHAFHMLSALLQDGRGQVDGCVEGGKDGKWRMGGRFTYSLFGFQVNLETCKSKCKASAYMSGPQPSIVSGSSFGQWQVDLL